MSLVGKCRCLLAALAMTMAVVPAHADSQAPDPLLVAVCNNDLQTVVDLSLDSADTESITWGRRKLNGLDLALANGHETIINHFLNIGVALSGTSMSLICDQKRARQICDRYSNWEGHTICRTALDPDRWNRTCHSPEGYCRKILKQATATDD